MNFFKRAWLNVWAKKGRSILLILVSSAILMFVLAGLLIRSAAVKATNQAKEEVGATVTLSANRQAAFKKMQSSSSSSKSSRPKLTLTPVKLSDATKIAKLSNISSYIPQLMPHPMIRCRPVVGWVATVAVAVLVVA